MKSKYYTIILLIIGVVMSLVPNFFGTYFNNKTEIEDYSNEYVIEQYDMEIEVREDNTISVKENISVNFKVSSNGIYRTLPKTSSMTYYENDKKTSGNYRLKYSAIQATALYEVRDENGYKVLVLGHVGANFNGLRTFQIIYNVDLGDDRNFKIDQFYYNIIGNYWNTKINKSTFKVKFPSPVNNQMTIYYGSYGTENNVSISSDEENVFSYTHNHVLGVGEGLTARVTMPNGYFVNNRSIILDIALLGGLLVLALMVISTYKNNNNPKIVIPVVNFEPPKRISSAEIGYYIDGVVDNTDIASLIVLWASKKYLTIQERESKLTLIKNNNVELDMKEYERRLYDAIFYQDEVEVEALGPKIFIEVANFNKQLTKQNKDRIFNQSAINSRSLIAILPALLLALVTWKVNYQVVENIRLFIGLACSFIWFISLTGFIFIKDKFAKYSDRKQKTFRILFYIILFLVCIVYAIFTYDFYCDPFFLTFISLLFAITCAIFALKMNIRTDEGLEIQGQLLGLRQFIEVAEKDRLEMLVHDKPEFFFDILPYAYVLGVSDVWIKKFENIAIQIPTWYDTDADVLTSYLFLVSLNRNLTRINEFAGYKIPQSAGSNFSGFSGGNFGGGFGGGGLGGGGGGRW